MSTLLLGSGMAKIRGAPDVASKELAMVATQLQSTAKDLQELAIEVTAASERRIIT